MAKRPVLDESEHCADNPLACKCHHQMWNYDHHEQRYGALARYIRQLEQYCDELEKERNEAGSI